MEKNGKNGKKWENPKTHNIYNYTYIRRIQQNVKYIPGKRCRIWPCMSTQKMEAWIKGERVSFGFLRLAIFRGKSVSKTPIGLVAYLKLDAGKGGRHKISMVPHSF